MVNEHPRGENVSSGRDRGSEGEEKGPLCACLHCPLVAIPAPLSCAEPAQKIHDFISFICFRVDRKPHDRLYLLPGAICSEFDAFLAEGGQF